MIQGEKEMGEAGDKRIFELCISSYTGKFGKLPHGRYPSVPHNLDTLNHATKAW